MFIPIALAQSTEADAQQIITGATNVVNLLVGIAFSVALILFFWGLARFILRLGSEEGSKEIANGKRLMIWGVIAMFIITSIWGITFFFQSFLGIENKEEAGVGPIEGFSDIEKEDIDTGSIPGSGGIDGTEGLLDNPWYVDIWNLVTGDDLGRNQGIRDTADINFEDINTGEVTTGEVNTTGIEGGEGISGTRILLDNPWYIDLWNWVTGDDLGRNEGIRGTGGIEGEDVSSGGVSGTGDIEF